jgi:hypothetical protein
MPFKTPEMIETTIEPNKAAKNDFTSKPRIK